LDFRLQRIFLALPPTRERSSLCGGNAHQPPTIGVRGWFMSQLSQPQTKKPSEGWLVYMENRWIFACGEYSSPCRLQASLTRSAAGMRTNRLLKASEVGLQVN